MRIARFRQATHVPRVQWRFILPLLAAAILAWVLIVSGVLAVVWGIGVVVGAMP